MSDRSGETGAGSERVPAGRAGRIARVFALPRRTIVGTLVRRRELLLMLVVHALKSRYRGAFFGYLWTLMAPLTLMAAYTLLLSVYLRVEVANYPAFLFSTFIPWAWFAASMQEGTYAILTNANQVTRARFDADLLPAVTVFGGLVHCALSLPLVMAFALASGRPLGWSILALPLLLALQLLLTLGPAAVLSVVNVYYRDVQHIMPTLLQVLFLATPIAYPSSIIPESLRFIAGLNPWFHLARAYQHVLYEGRMPLASDLALVTVVGLAVHLASERFFARYRDRLAEEL